MADDAVALRCTLCDEVLIGNRPFSGHGIALITATHFAARHAGDLPAQRQAPADEHEPGGATTHA